MTTPGAPPARRRDRVQVVLAVCVAVWVVCSVAVVWLFQASLVAEERRHTVRGYDGPSQDDLEMWLLLPFLLGGVALAVAICVVVAGSVARRRAAVAACERV